ncbi:MAG TPA: twin-arginine translocation signal domain-containing protein [Terriglobales bacterium]|nr:twin-arginine translocation signal domain-containing protein [Terriglobales bacterium]
MKDPQSCPDGTPPVAGEETHDKQTQQANGPADTSRRSFLGKMGVGGAAAVALAAVPFEPLIEGKHGEAEASVVPYRSNNRANDSFNYRKNTAIAEKIDVGVQPDNGDIRRFLDYSAQYSKGLQHDALGIPNRSSYQSMLFALQSGRFSDFQNILVGSPGGPGPVSQLNGPQGSLAFDLEGLDSHATIIPPAPSVASAQTAAEEAEHYWAGVLRDVNFSDYSGSLLAAQACADLNNMSYVKSAGSQFPYPVTPANLFRGQFVPGDGPVQGPYLSQFMIQPTFFGCQPITQQMQRFQSIGSGGADFMTDPVEFQHVQNGGNPNGHVTFDPNFLFMRMGRDLASYTRVDVLYQAYFTAFLILAGIKAPPNPGNPYIGSRSEKGFGTLGGPDAAGTIGEMATRALKGAWFHKWIVDLRMRPEEYGGLVHARLTSQNPMPQAALALHSDMLNSAVLPIIYSTYGSYLLPQPFPEGSPTHPCYPTGHGTVGGACITAAKFFFDGSKKIQPLLQAAGSDVMMPSEDGTTLVPYTGSDAGDLTINGELSKLGWNITQGHGIHAGIHFRSSSFWSLLLGEQIGLRVLQDRAASYNEPFTINVTKFDGSTATISNQ